PRGDVRAARAALHHPPAAVPGLEDAGLELGARREALDAHVAGEGVPRVTHHDGGATGVAVVVGGVGELPVPPDRDPLAWGEVLGVPHPDADVVRHVVLLLLL